MLRKSEGDTCRVRITNRMCSGRVGHRDDHVGGNRMLPSQSTSQTTSHPVDGAAFQNGIRPGEVDVFEDAQGWSGV